ncbi:hypothetical protein SO802_008897 [Lithocarpus litseifolius]|uniref:Neprosin PEP catalytic domain-containing protein n=1 Tax=Lithocarpus litseifolius TaxID=425828 RepID=A0AAW2D9W7_9ROSI
MDVNDNWWIFIDENVVGYYPVALFSNLINPKTIGWGGVTSIAPNGINPSMGSGSFPSDGASSFSNIHFRNQWKIKAAPQSNEYDIIIDRPKCYDLKDDGYKDDNLGFTFQFGGLGEQCDN